MARTNRSLLGRKIVGRGGGSKQETWESKQQRAVAEAGMSALARAKGQPVGKEWARNAIEAAERGTSISASKTRERGRSKRPAKKKP
jgi:hypothetical protein